MKKVNRKLSKKEKKRIVLEKQRHRSQKAFEEHKLREMRLKNEFNIKAKKKKTILIVFSLIFFLLISFGAYVLLSPGKYDIFAKCLTDKGAMMYGEDWCKYTNAQKAMFGKSFKYINYEVKKDLNLRPTWVINGESYEKVQSFQKLSELTGCKYQGGKK